MDKSIKSSFRFDNYYVDHIEFKINRDHVFDDNPIDVEIETTFEVGFHLNHEQKRALITIDCVIFDEFITRNFPFYVRVRLIGEFSIEGDSNSDDFVKFVEVNGTSVLFPYLRSTISTVTSAAGVPPLNLPLINMHKLIEAQKAERQE